MREYRLLEDELRDIEKIDSYPPGENKDKKRLANYADIMMNKVRILRENIRGKAFSPRRMDIEVLRVSKKGFKGVVIKEVR